MCCSSGLSLETRLKGLICFILSSVIELEFVKTDTSFLAIYQDTCWHNNPSYDSYNTLFG